jgi:hypothetical protein
MMIKVLVAEVGQQENNTVDEEVGDMGSSEFGSDEEVNYSSLTNDSRMETGLIQRMSCRTTQISSQTS